MTTNSDDGITALPPYYYLGSFASTKQIRLLHVVPEDTLSAEQPSRVGGLDVLPKHQSDHLTCTLTTWDIAVAPPYTAISYTWGSDTASDPRSIEIDGRALSVRRNAYCAIRDVDRVVKCEYYWIDSICINQRNNVEKADQVKMMGTIFHTAQTVVSVVGAHKDGSKDLLEMLANKDQSQDDVELHLDTRLDTALTRFTEREYWQRLWTIQECVAAQDLRLLCGSDVFYFSTFNALGRDTRSISEVQRTHMWAVLGLRKEKDPRLKFQDVIGTFGHWKCKDVRDRVFGLLYLVGWPKNSSPLAPDYGKTNKGVARDAFLHCTTPHGIRTVCQVLGVYVPGTSTLTDAALDCCSRTSDILFLQQKLNFRSIGNLSMARAVANNMATIDEKCFVWRLLPRDLPMAERLLLIHDSAEIWPSIGSPRKVLEKLSFALNSGDERHQNGHVAPTLTTFSTDIAIAERVKILLAALPCVRSTTHMADLLHGLALPCIDIDTAKHVADCAMNAELLGLVLDKLCADVDPLNRLRLALRFLKRHTPAEDVATVMKAMGLVWNVNVREEELELLLCEPAVCIRRLLVLLQALKLQVTFDPTLIYVGVSRVSSRASLWSPNLLSEADDFDRRMLDMASNRMKQSWAACGFSNIDEGLRFMSCCGWQFTAIVSDVYKKLDPDEERRQAWKTLRTRLLGHRVASDDEMKFPEMAIQGLFAVKNTSELLFNDLEVGMINHELCFPDRVVFLGCINGSWIILHEIASNLRSWRCYNIIGFARLTESIESGIALEMNACTAELRMTQESIRAFISAANGGEADLLGGVGSNCFAKIEQGFMGARPNGSIRLDNDRCRCEILRR